MDNKILKVFLAILFTRGFSSALNIHSFYSKNININMRTVIMEEGVLQHGDVLNNEDQIAFSSWKQGEEIPAGTYALYLRSYGDLNLKLEEFEYDGNDHKKWTKIKDLTWVDFPKNLTKMNFSLVLQAISLRPSSQTFVPSMINIFGFTPPIPYFSSAENWKYKIYLKTKEESGEGIREDSDIDSTFEFCSKSVESVGSNKTLTARCPYDPDTGTQMENCLNWRRVDQVGIDCYKIMDTLNKNKSITTFCNNVNNTYTADCKCINRLSYPEYVELKKLYNDSEYCWYFPCKTGAYLLDKEGTLEKCNGNYCIILHNTSNVAGNVNVSKNSSDIACFNMKGPTTSEYSSKKRV